MLRARSTLTSTATTTAKRCSALIERKVAGEEVAIAPAPAPPAAVPDLMAALQASIAAVGKHGERWEDDGPPHGGQPVRAEASQHPGGRRARRGQAAEPARKS